MFDSDDALSVRTVQFEHFLRSMNVRAHEVAHGPCFIRFSCPPTSNRKDRFVQFSFEKDCFHLDLPQQTLSKDEAEQIRATRNGFFYLREGPEYTLHEEDTEGADPFRTVYFYGDERTASQDMAHIFYRVWRISPNARLFVTAASFNGKHKWEHELLVAHPRDEDTE